MTASVINGTPIDVNYNNTVAQALDAALKRAQETPQHVLNPAKERYIILSDQHKGVRNGADDFRDTETAYNAALEYYYAQNYTLIELGDCEELWEEYPGPVIKSYRDTLNLTARFHQDGRYLRVWGNHDDEWRNPASVTHYLSSIFGSPSLTVPESILFSVVNDNQTIGTLFLVHGHQGTLDSDRFSWLSRLIVRYIWRPIQRLTNWRSTTPATSWELRQKHNVALYMWSEKQQKTILIAGHTHRPVFEALVNVETVANELAALQQKDSADMETAEQITELEAELEWVQEQSTQLESGLDTTIKPSYFNSGCCVYSDASLTGIEISAGEIRLVRWPNAAGHNEPEVLQHGALSAIFEML